MTLFRKLAVAFAAAGMIAASIPAPATAGNNAAAGFVAGAIIGGALSASRPPVYAPVPTYQVAPQPVYRNCWQRQKFYDPYVGWVWRRVYVC